MVIIKGAVLRGRQCSSVIVRHEPNDDFECPRLCADEAATHNTSSNEQLLISG
jgi:hypothetical protein